MDVKEIGARITSAREEVGITRKELAEKIGVAASTITHYERGNFLAPKIPVIDAIARALNVNPLWLTSKSSYKKTQEMIDEWEIDPSTLSPQEKSLVRDYRSLNEDGQSKAASYVSDLTSMDKYTRQESSEERAM